MARVNWADSQFVYFAKEGIVTLEKKDGKIKGTARSITVFIGPISAIIDPDDIKTALVLSGRKWVEVGDRGLD